MKKITEQHKSDSRGALTPEFLKRFAFLAVANGEVGSTNPYASSLSTGESGLAFGRMQNDTRKKTGNTIAQTYLRKILDADVAGKHLDKEKADTLYEKTLVYHTLPGHRRPRQPLLINVNAAAPQTLCTPPGSQNHTLGRPASRAARTTGDTHPESGWSRAAGGRPGGR